MVSKFNPWKTSLLPLTKMVVVRGLVVPAARALVSIVVCRWFVVVLVRGLTTLLFFVFFAFFFTATKRHH